MGWLRPARRVDGRAWEVYVYRIEPPDWQPGSGGGDLDPGGWAPGELLLWLVRVPFALVTELLLPLARLVVGLPLALVRGRGSTSLTVEAICFTPREERHRWTTTRDHVERVVDQIANELRAGELARPLGARFRGAR